MADHLSTVENSDRDDVFEGMKASERLQKLTENIRDQDDLERDVAHEADQLLLEQANALDMRRLERIQRDSERLAAGVEKLEHKLSQNLASSAVGQIQAEIGHLRSKMQGLSEDAVQVQERMDERHRQDQGEALPAEASGNRRLPQETKREFLIRTGKITPFAKPDRPSAITGTLQDVIAEAEEGTLLDEAYFDEEGNHVGDMGQTLSHQNLRMPGFLAGSGDSRSPTPPVKRRRVHTLSDSGAASSDVIDLTTSDAETSDHESAELPISRKRKSPSRATVSGDREQANDKEGLADVDDGNERLYQKRLKKWAVSRKQARENAHPEQGAGDHPVHEECFHPHPTEADVEIEPGFRVPGDIYPSLFDYQKTGVQWLSQLYSQQNGGIVGDEMGLGKTIQVISFLACLHHSKKLTKPIIVVTPATVMKQWVNEFHRWWPAFRVSILHTSGSGMLNVRGEARMESESESESGNGRAQTGKIKAHARRTVNTVLEQGHVLVTTYSGLQTYARLLLPVQWEYAVLDEGHKIRNPNAAVTIHCKELKTANKIILSGTPMQNNLTELWSLFDFVYPMRLGTLENFKMQFDTPIRIGGYANASNLEVQTAIECAARLKDAISPYLLHRLKVDVASDLPQKTERVLFCKLTKTQKNEYEEFIASPTVTAIMKGERQSFGGIDHLRKICNHPDLNDRDHLKKKQGYHYGNPLKSGKMQVVKALLEEWKEGGHKTLLFAQQKIMLDILETFVRTLPGIAHCRMDGDTPIEHRQGLVDRFNNSPELNLFLLTTKVGGLGINLTGADRIIIFDPDWNPSTDTQARERAWRLGQKREVEIYRLMCVGTIEEKIYHRQLFKQFLANKVMRDPNQRRAFQLKDLHDLFSFGEKIGSETETGALFKGTEKVLAERDEPARRAHNLDHDLDNNGKDDPNRLRSIRGVAKLEDFQAPQDNTSKATNNESRVLEGILAGAGVHSALEHDEVLNGPGKKRIQADPEIIRRAALDMADKAARELKKAETIARNVPVGTPTWTGQVGVTGRPQPPAHQGRGASSVSGRSGVVAGRAASGTSGDVGARRNQVPMAERIATNFTEKLRNFLLANNGSVYSKMLIDQFHSTTGTPERKRIFLEVLHKLAMMEKGSHLRSKWVLKEEYR